MIIYFDYEVLGINLHVHTLLLSADGEGDTFITTSGTHSVGGHSRRAVMPYDGRKFSPLWYSYGTSITYMIHHWPEFFVKHDCIPIPNILHVDQYCIVMYF